MKKPDDHAFGVTDEPVFCEHCEVEIDPKSDNNYCEKCNEYFFCECGQRLEDSWGSPGDGFCIRCR